MRALRAHRKAPVYFHLSSVFVLLSLPFLGQMWSCFDLPFPRNLIPVFHPNLPKNRKNKGYSCFISKASKVFSQN